MADDPMWSIVMFDLPVLTAKQRREANQFRHLLLDEGFWMAQYSVYVRYSPTMSGEVRRIRAIKAALPDGGEVRVLYVTGSRVVDHALFSRGGSSCPGSRTPAAHDFLVMENCVCTGQDPLAGS